MRKHTSLYYLAVFGIALAAPLLMQKLYPRDAAHGQAAPPGQAASHAAPAAPSAAPPAISAETVVARPPAAAPAAERTFDIDTEEFQARVSSLNGGVKSFTLKDKQFERKGIATNVVTTDKPAYYPLSFRLIGAQLGDHPQWQAQSIGPRAVRLHTEADGIAIERKLEAGNGPYQLWLTTTLHNRSDKPRKLTLDETTFHYLARAAESGGVPLLPANSPKISAGLCAHADDLEREQRKALTTPHEWKDGVRFVGLEDVYFLNALVAVGEKGHSCRLEASDRGRDSSGDPVGSLFTASLRHPEQTLAPGQKRTVRVLAYLGPKMRDELSHVGHGLRSAINTGFFTSLADGLTSLLALIHGTVGNWGIAIILLTFFVKLALYPLTHKQMQSMAKMKELKPEMDRINALYADDREKKGAAVMELYRKKGVNPMAGCFPVLLQLPIWFSLYSSLSSNIRLLNAPFALWWSDLSSPDPYFVLPLALGVLMFVQQKLAPPAGTDPLQAKMMLYMMPTMITSFMLFLPAGLCLYMFTNSALSIVQQRVIETRLKNKVPATAPAASVSAVPKVVADNELDAQAGSKDKPAQRRLRRGRK
ncbi:MAG: membrane protein insertase YidC [Polyangiales bacterium]